LRKRKWINNDEGGAASMSEESKSASKIGISHYSRITRKLHYFLKDMKKEGGVRNTNTNTHHQHI
jgi:hypothetical protein